MLFKIKSYLAKHDHLRQLLTKANHICIYILVTLSPILASKYLYYTVLGKSLNLKHPADFNEKIQWLKFNQINPKTTWCADKFAVRSYISKECGLEFILNDLFGVYDDPRQIQWDFLPNKFVLKTTNAGDTNIFCADKKYFDIENAVRQLNRWMKIDYGKKYAEIHYSRIKPRIICERYLETDNGSMLTDYKFFCFNGEPKYLYVGITENGYTHKTFYDMNWNKQDFLKSGFKSYDHDRPACLFEMISYSRIISREFPFVRVDFYIYKEKPIFGEMTFTPTGGMADYYNETALKHLGDLLTLPKILK